MCKFQTLEKERKEKVWDGKDPRGQKKTRLLSGVTYGHRAGLRPESSGRHWAERAGNCGGENLSSCPLTHVSRSEHDREARRERRTGSWGSILG